jgi:hypothetical protein
MSEERAHEPGPRVLDHADREMVSFWAVLRETADLRPALRMDDWTVRGEFVEAELRRVASASQAGLAAWLASHDVPYSSFLDRERGPDHRACGSHSKETVICVSEALPTLVHAIEVNARPDNGLFGHVLLPFMSRGDNHFLTTESFARNPASWLGVASDVRARSPRGPHRPVRWPWPPSSAVLRGSTSPTSAWRSCRRRPSIRIRSISSGRRAPVSGSGPERWPEDTAWPRPPSE